MRVGTGTGTGTFPTVAGAGTHPHSWSAPATTTPPDVQGLYYGSAPATTTPPDAQGLYYGQATTNVSYEHPSHNAYLNNMLSYYNTANTTSDNQAKVQAAASTSSNFNYLSSDFDPIHVPCAESVTTDKIGSTCCPTQSHNAYGYVDKMAAAALKSLIPESTLSLPIIKSKEPEKTIEIAGISEKPLTASDVMNLVAARANDVITRYLPCVEFLVICQQELRRGVEKNRRDPAKQRGTVRQVSVLA